MKYRQALFNRIRFSNKHVLNPVILKFAGSPHSPISVIRHAGRRSGKPYSTPIIVEPLIDGFVFALTYGPKVDWYRNVLAAGWCTVIWHGKEYVIENPEPLDVKKALPAFPLALRLILQIMGTHYFLRMKSQKVIG